MLQILFRELQDPNQANENSRGLQQLLQLWIGDLTQSLAVSQSLSGRAVSHQAFVFPPVLANYFSLPSSSASSGHLPNLGDEAESAWSQLITEDRQPAKIFTSSAARQDRKETLFGVGARRLNKHQPQNKNMHKVDDFSSRLLFEWNVGSERLYSLTKTTSGANSNSCFGGRCQKAMLGVCLWRWKVGPTNGKLLGNGHGNRDIRKVWRVITFVLKQSPTRGFARSLIQPMSCGKKHEKV